MMQFIRLLAASLTCLILFGCAHPITMAPDLATVQASGAAKSAKSVGFYIADADRALEVTTAGGGGDKIRYFPYRDIEAGLYKALSEIFPSVTKITNASDTTELKKSGISLLIVPTLTTDSSSPSPFTWPPTKFSVTLACTISNAEGKPVQKLSVTGEGAAEFDEFKKNHSLAAVRASNDALAKLIKALSNSPELRK